MEAAMFKKYRLLALGLLITCSSLNSGYFTNYSKAHSFAMVSTIYAATSLYNKEIKLPNKFNYERFYRKDNLYDIIVPLNYNTNRIIKNKGSAIFIHVADNNYKRTAGCIGMKKNNLIKLLSIIKKNTNVKIC